MPITTTFAGGGVAPRLTSAVPITTTRLRATFSEAMAADVALGTAANYTLAVVGASVARTVTAVILESSTTVLLDVSGTLSVGAPAYTLLVANVVDLAANVIDPAFDTVNITVPTTTLQVLRAAALDDRTMRVWLSTEPRHVSGHAPDDALNRFNWSIGVQAGGVTAPVVEAPLQVIPAPLTGAAGAWAVDLAVDRALMAHATYRVTAGARITSADSSTLMALSPANRFDAFGLAPRRASRPSRILVREQLDLAPSGGGAWVATETGGLALHGGDEACRKRVIRRVTTPKGAFYHLPKYGSGVRIKATMRVGDLAVLQHDILRGVREEPDIEAASVVVSKLTTGAFQFAIRGRTFQGQDVSASGLVPR